MKHGMRVYGVEGGAVVTMPRPAPGVDYWNQERHGSARAVALANYLGTTIAIKWRPRTLVVRVDNIRFSRDHRPMSLAEEHGSLVQYAVADATAIVVNVLRLPRDWQPAWVRVTTSQPVRVQHTYLGKSYLLSDGEWLVPLPSRETAATGGTQHATAP